MKLSSEYIAGGPTHILSILNVFGINISVDKRRFHFPSTETSLSILKVLQEKDVNIVPSIRKYRNSESKQAMSSKFCKV